MVKKSAIGAACVTLIGAFCLSSVFFAAQAGVSITDAARKGDKETLRSLLKKGADVNASQGDGMTALHWAANNGDLETAQILIYAGANVHAATRINNITPLFLAAEAGKATLVEALLQAGADANFTLMTGTTPLMVAAASGSVPTVKTLLEHGAAVNAKETAQGQTALMFAAQYNSAEVIKVLMESHADALVATTVLEMPGATPRQTTAAAAAQNGEGGGGQPEFLGGLNALLFASRQGHMEAVRALLDAGANVNEVNPRDKTSPLLIAIVNGHYDVAQFLLNRGANPTLANTLGATPLYATVNLQWAPQAAFPQPDSTQEKVKYLELMSALLDRGADPNARLKKPLWWTSYGLHRSGVSAGGATAFWRAAQSGDVDAMRLLISRAADPTIPTNEGVTPLHVVTGAGVQGTNEVFMPGGLLPAVKYLVDELGLDVNRSDPNGYTPLHHAAYIGSDDIIQFLVAHGAKVDAVSKRGETVADMANSPESGDKRKEPYPKTIALLVKLGAKVNNKCTRC